MNRRPQWDDSLADRTQYRLTYAEQLQRKAALVSKNKESAKEELNKRHEMLKQGKIPEELKKTLRNSSTKAKATQNSHKPTSSASNLKPASKIALNGKESNDLQQNVTSNKIETHFAPLKKTGKPSIEDQLDTLTKLDQAMKELEAAMLKAASPDCKRIDAQEVKSHDESISEGSLFGISDDDDYMSSKFSEKSKPNEKEDLRSRYHEILNGVNKEFTSDYRACEELSVPSQLSSQYLPNSSFPTSTTKPAADPSYYSPSKPYQSPINPSQSFGKPGQGLQTAPKASSSQLKASGPGLQGKEAAFNFFHEDPIEYENVWADEDNTKILSLVEQTRKDLLDMNISTNENFEVTAPAVPFKYDNDVVPQQFNLVPLDKPNIPRAGTSSLSLFDHVRNVKIDCRKFIIN